MQIKLASVPVRDQERALAFYTEKLGSGSTPTCRRASTGG
jgi:hypothetical protein